MLIPPLLHMYRQPPIYWDVPLLPPLPPLLLPASLPPLGLIAVAKVPVPMTAHLLRRAAAAAAAAAVAAAAALLRERLADLHRGVHELAVGLLQARQVLLALLLLDLGDGGVDVIDHVLGQARLWRCTQGREWRSVTHDFQNHV